MGLFADPLVGSVVRRALSVAEAVAISLFIYYVAEELVITVLVAFAQRAGELRFGRREVPWGGLLLACTWGGHTHLLAGTKRGFYATFASVLYGVVYAVGPRLLAPTIALIGIAFIA